MIARKSTGHHALALALDFGVRTVGVAALILAVSGCRPGEDTQQTPDTAVTRTAQSGTVSLTMNVTSTEFDFPGKTRIVITMAAPSAYSVSLDDYPSLLQESGLGFELRVTPLESKTIGPSPDGVTTLRETYELECVLPGEYELPGAALSFYAESPNGELPDGELPDNGDAQRRLMQLSTESVKIVAHDPADRQLSEEELATIQTLDPIELPGVWSRWWWLAPLIGVFVLVAAILILPRLLRRWRRRRHEQKQVVMIPPHQWAQREFAALVAAQLLEQGLAHEYHYRISYIVRGYLELRFGFRAGEMTSEEFLNAVVVDPRLEEELQTELRRFIAATDMVKYARHEPSQDESSEALRAAESFVDRTRAESSAASHTAIASAETTYATPTRERVA